MNLKIFLATMAFGALVLPPTGAAALDGQGISIVPSNDAIDWKPGPAILPKGSQLVVLNGDPGKPGPFVLRVKFPPRTIVAPHTHATAENLTVLSGTLYHDMGKTLDKARSVKVEATGFVYLPADMPHSVWTTDAETIVQVTGTGPFGLTYVNPADDPSKAR
jgi:quercetin dioxygenase-like cupin family protein